MKGFKEFVMQGSVIDLAVGVVIGAAFTALITAFVDNLINWDYVEEMYRQATA